jgi:hypothetical protein
LSIYFDFANVAQLFKLASFKKLDLYNIFFINNPIERRLKMLKVKLLLSSIVMSIFLITGWAYSATFTVTTLDDSGDGSLRWAIEQANGNPGPDRIIFIVSGIISLTSGLPDINDDGTVIDASSQWDGIWPGGQPGITLDGAGAGDGVVGLPISGANNCRIRGLFITNFTSSGVFIDGESNFIGGIGEGHRNVISGNNLGVGIGGSSANNNRVLGNYIGTDVDGTTALGNAGEGVLIGGGAQSNTIGGTTEGEKNIISGNGNNGVFIDGSGTNNNIVSSNYIGTDVNGTAALGNSGNGVSIGGGAQSNTIGGITEGERNIISGNGDGVWLGDSGTDNNVVSGNYIGTDVNGTAALGNSNGVVIGNGAQFNTIGGTTEGERNIISGNGTDGVVIFGSGTDNNEVSGNYIGIDVNGTAALGNSLSGVWIGDGPQSNTIGGATEGARNIISGNGGNGVQIESSGTNNNEVSGNYIGTDVNGTAALGNAGHGVGIGDGAQSNTIGGNTEGARNIISGNGGGVSIGGSGANNNVVAGNYIGTDVNGTAALGNSGSGVGISNGAQSNTIGGADDSERNIISGNDGHGIEIFGTETNNNVVFGNYIGVDVSETAMGNSHVGVKIGEEAQSNTIGPGNTIAFNSHDGIEVSGANTDYNKISENSIHDNGGPGINLADGGNDEIPPPTIRENNLVDDILTVSGNGAGADATVEIFEADSFDSGEGKTYLGSLTADGDGNFSGDIDVTGKGLSVGDPLVATTTYIDNNTSEFSTPDTTLPVELSVFTAGFEDGAVRVHWRTESETNNLGFDIYRSESKDGPFEKVNFLMIKGAGSSGEAHEYEYVDADVEVGKRYFYYLEDIDIFGMRSKSHIIEVTMAKVALPKVLLPKEFALLQNFPNPFNPETWIPYQIRESADVVIRIYDTHGRLVRTIDLGHRKAGFYLGRTSAAYWDGRNDAGEQVASGVYFYQLQAGDFSATRRMVIVK